ncbi:peptide deformylase [Candidatus Peregrinibacteria bacterium]|jgi:peptide deformylase|nr:peptide deformylase [Candidatus Peregrinibacteria bacterium]MBT5468370.1 peptide deformylase [Candidatus Peregrinibacteria bacterium]MBT7337766.1 peptide deformylase [Candidatus Peregrinibacteria bacterium]MBT7494594.1 peptide deformylase [Candidatus Peribacter sp.]
MTVLPIIKGEETEVLRTKAATVLQVTKEILKLIKNMEETVKKAEGLGLAAPQIGQSVRVCLVMLHGKMTPMINPEITWRSEEATVMTEGCLSLPKIEVEVTRPVEVIVKYTNKKGQEQERRLHDLDAKVMQHEFDHLNGVLIVDYQ